MTGSTNVKRAAKRRRRRPYRQGDLDGLCGLYSTVNAVRVLCPEVDTEAAGALFATLMQGLNEAGAAAEDVVTGGSVGTSWPTSSGKPSPSWPTSTRSG